MDRQQRIMNFIVEDALASEEDDLTFRTMLCTCFSYLRNERVCVTGFHEEVIERLDDIGFRSHFRVYRTTFAVILDIVGQELAANVNGLGRPKYSPEQQLEMALWHLVNQEVHRKSALLFNVCMHTVWRATNDVCTALINHRQEIIYWPKGQEAIDIMEEFEDVAGIPNVIGDIDGSEIPVSDPLEDPQSYMNRKGFTSIKLQGVVRRNTKFLDVYTGEPGGMHDARQFRRSPLYMDIQNPVLRRTMFPRNSHLLGDSAYPLSTVLLAPYRNVNLNVVQSRFNTAHSSTRLFVEHSFGLLKNRFRCLKYILRYDPRLPPMLTLACCILHNLCIDQNDIYDFVPDDNINIHIHPDGVGNNGIAAVQKRDLIALAL